MITTEYIRRKLKTSENKSQLCFKTKGQPPVFQKITVLRKSSSRTTSPVRRRRAKGVDVKQFQDQIAGTSENDIARQHATDLKRIKGKAKKKPGIIFWIKQTEIFPSRSSGNERNNEYNISPV